VVEHLPSKCEALSSITKKCEALSSITEKERKKEKKASLVAPRPGRHSGEAARGPVFGARASVGQLPLLRYALKGAACTGENTGQCPEVKTRP
jgi:hypothetical protein